MLLNWTPTAIYCHDSGQDCSNCGSRVDGCQMPIVIEALMHNQILLPSERHRIEAYNTRCINQRLSPWLKRAG